MVSGILGQLLQEIGAKLGIPNLSPDNKDTCLIKLKNNVPIQFELDSLGQFLIMGTVIGTVTTGRYRIDLFKAALRSNGGTPPLHGIFAFSKKTDHLILYERFHIQNLRGDQIADEIAIFSEKAKVWIEAVAHNDVPIVQDANAPAMSQNIFGLRR